MSVRSILPVCSVLSLIACGGDDAAAPPAFNSATDTASSGCVVFTAADGTTTDYSAQFASGTAEAPVTVKLSQDGDLSVCAGTHYVKLRLKADIAVTGEGSESTIIDGGGVKSGFVIAGSEHLTVSLGGLAVRSGVATRSTAYGSGGGGVYCEDATLTMDNVLFEGNAAASGGAYFGLDCTTDLLHVGFEGNTATRYGGAIMLSGGSVSLTGASYATDNLADDSGGAVFAYAGLFEADNVMFKDNEAALKGGGIMGYEATVNLSNSVLRDNSAWKGGGLILNSSSTGALSGVSVEGNTASGKGGGIRIGNNNAMEATDLTFHSNSPEDVSRNSRAYTFMDGAAEAVSCPMDSGPCSATIEAILTDADAVAAFCDGGHEDITINGAIGMHADQLESFEGLECVTAVTGNIEVANTGALTSLAGLDNLTAVNDLIINGAPIGSLSPLSSLQQVSYLLVLGTELTSLEGLEQITAMQYLALFENEHLSSLAGLDNLTESTDGVIIMDNPSLCSDEIDALLAQLEMVGQEDIYFNGDSCE